MLSCCNCDRLVLHILCYPLRTLNFLLTDAAGEGADPPAGNQLRLPEAGNFYHHYPVA